MKQECCAEWWMFLAAIRSLRLVLKPLRIVLPISHNPGKSPMVLDIPNIPDKYVKERDRPSRDTFLTVPAIMFRTLGETLGFSLIFSRI